MVPSLFASGPIHTNRMKVLWPFHSGERMLQGVRRPVNERAKEQIGQVHIGRLLQGTNWHGSEKTVNCLSI